jgi:hypothetical protein
MASRKKLNVGMVGYGFMGRAHSNAFARVNQFFDVGYEPVLKGCLRTGQGESRSLPPDLELRFLRDRLAQACRAQRH